MGTHDFIKRRIELKEQLIFLVGREIDALKEELKGLDGKSPFNSSSDREVQDATQQTAAHLS